ncbi:hypothetical protein [Streptomyces rapamycinicus]|uniref:Uncharacterized protein n=2 Tax=Streptomyces rapamycinicus TaxID=1226757 RepID=A0A0A0NJ81_STRRN|nr:hypothetical protein [Streptomyces rapamycinicus]AGP56168.1 hypothetical protein M271_23270 [Streptomyces rapamycinicus NRRL 5491]MBB4783775.1 hypothetical protein [Streptomyces rapamycinicus]RLV80754.1 hypothetical protein D3C57_120255 [Streptomyces rapamycinicus NRRL 5491]UTO64132.1 hypothetical protein LJB45_18570 [Streptomyces rapamycinicus]UTP32087.1 hypothetical protein LIV37_23690 [Streptomyces rapamycinicus NRRL 5491]
MTHNLPEPAADLLRAILEALDIPHPATVGDSEVHARVLADRVMHTVVALHGVLDEGVTRHLGIEWTTAHLRERLAEHPPTGYRTAGIPRPGGERP